MRWLVAAILIFSIALPATAQEHEPEVGPLITDRPDFTESTAAVPRLQLESGYTYARAGETEEHTIGELLLRVPVARRVEFRLGINSFALSRAPGSDASGLEDASMGVKVNLAGGSERFDLLQPSVGVIAETTLPTGDDAFGESDFQPGATLAVAWDLSDRVGLGSNLGYTYASEGGDRFGEFSGSIALGYGLTERLGSYIEAFGFMPSDEHGPNTSFVNGGLTYLLSDDVQLDMRTGIGLNAVDSSYFVGIGLSRRW